MDMFDKNTVQVDCINNKMNHPTKTYGLLEGSFTVGSVKGNGQGGFTCDVTVNPDRYVSDYNKSVSSSSGHVLSPAGQTGKITLRWNGTKWVLASELPITFTVICTDSPELPPPGKPTDQDLIKNILSDGAVVVDCVNRSAGHADKTYGLMSGTYTIGDVQGSAKAGYTCIIEVNKPQPYVNAYNNHTPGHTLTEANQRGTIKLVYTDRGWKPDKDYRPVRFTVICESVTSAVPVDPSDLPKTGDASNLVLWAALAALCGSLSLLSRRRYSHR